MSPCSWPVHCVSLAGADLLRDAPGMGFRIASLPEHLTPWGACGVVGEFSGRVWEVCIGTHRLAASSGPHCGHCTTSRAFGAVYCSQGLQHPTHTPSCNQRVCSRMRSWPNAVTYLVLKKCSLYLWGCLDL